MARMPQIIADWRRVRIICASLAVCAVLLIVALGNARGEGEEEAGAALLSVPRSTFHSTFCYILLYSLPSKLILSRLTYFLAFGALRYGYLP